MQPTKRNQFFDGKLLDAKDLTREQEYHQDRRDLPQATAEKRGIVSGLAVSSPTTSSLYISPGIGVSSSGDVISATLEKPDEKTPAAPKNRRTKT